MKITFDEFGWRSLEERAAEEGTSLDEFLSLALSYYESELSSGRAAIEVPRFRQTPGGEARTVTVEIDGEVMRRVEDEGERRGVAVERVCEYAALFFLADLDAGRVAEQVIQRARSGAGPPRFRPGPSA